ncbi:hypothetical protein BGZ52_001833, partial [Haplosporangium bisporale]
ILRTFYNMTQGSYWSNQDGWQYVDSVAIPRPQPGRQPGRYRHSDVKISRRQVVPSTNSDSKPLRTSSSDNLNRARSIVPKDKADDGSSSDGPETQPDTHPDTMPRPPESDSNDRPRSSRGGGDTSSMPGTNPSTEFDVDNCCGWYGVVCIGPDGKFPPNWPPYDEDLISSRFATSEPALSTAPLKLLNKRKEPYYSSHDRQWRHHHLGGNRGGRGKGDDRDGDDGYYGGRTDNDDSEIRTPQRSQDSPTDTTGDTMADRGEGSKLLDIDDWYIIELHLRFNGLVGPVPDVLSKLANLMILDLSNNELGGQIPESYRNLTRLERFDIGCNKITGPFPLAVTKMINLQELVLKNNYFTGHLPPELLQLKQLTELSIANNEFDGLLPQGLFSSLKKLRVVNINQNGFTGEISSDVGGLTGLLKFAARANEFTGKIPKEFGNCKLLSSISLGDNHLTGEIPESIYTLRNLKILDLPDNKLTGSISPKIGNMAGLTKLYDGHNSFNGSLPFEIQNLTRLESMVVNYNSFSGVFPVAQAPPLMTFCLVQPNSFQNCPSNVSVENSTTLAYQCNLDCSDRVLHPEIYETISSSSPAKEGTILSRIIFTSVAAIVLGGIF